jgi:Zn-dependent membrane protease YugP
MHCSTPRASACWRCAPASPRAAIALNKITAVVMLLSPVIGAVTRAPGLVFIELGVGSGLMALSIVLHAVTLPVELNASFGRALPILDKGQYLDRRDLPAARSILRAAALTYVAGRWPACWTSRAGSASCDR